MNKRKFKLIAAGLIFFLIAFFIDRQASLKPIYFNLKLGIVMVDCFSWYLAGIIFARLFFIRMQEWEGRHSFLLLLTIAVLVLPGNIQLISEFREKWNVFIVIYLVFGWIGMMGYKFYTIRNIEPGLHGEE